MGIRHVIAGVSLIGTIGCQNISSAASGASKAVENGAEVSHCDAAVLTAVAQEIPALDSALQEFARQTVLSPDSLQVSSVDSALLLGRNYLPAREELRALLDRFEEVDRQYAILPDSITRHYSFEAHPELEPWARTTSPVPVVIASAKVTFNRSLGLHPLMYDSLKAARAVVRGGTLATTSDSTITLNPYGIMEPSTAAHELVHVLQFSREAQLRPSCSRELLSCDSALEGVAMFLAERISAPAGSSPLLRSALDIRLAHSLGAQALVRAREHSESATTLAFKYNISGAILANRASHVGAKAAIAQYLAHPPCLLRTYLQANTTTVVTGQAR